MRALRRAPAGARVEQLVILKTCASASLSGTSAQSGLPSRPDLTGAVCGQ
jgi:hypothetical protein